LNELSPVSGNWCWISGTRTDLRYALGHGWRFSIIFGTIGIYIYIWIYMRRHFSQLHSMSQGGSYNQASAAKRREFRRDDAHELRSESQTELHEINVEYAYEVKHSDGMSDTNLGKEDIIFTASDLETNSRKSAATLSPPMSPKSPYFQTASGMSFPMQMRTSISLNHNVTILMVTSLPVRNNCAFR
jgi:hypothetical protein